MSLLAYNLTTSPIVPTGTSVTLPASTSAGIRGAAYNITSELAAFNPSQFAALQTQANPNTEAPLVVIYQWTGLPEYPTPGLSVNAPAGLVAQDDFLLWISPTGVVGAGGTSTTPTTIADALQRLPASHYKRCQLIALAGSYTWPTSADPIPSQQQGNLSSPFVIIGDFTNEVGDVVSDSADAQGRYITDSALAPAVDLYRGYYLSIIVAGVVQQRRMITGNGLKAATGMILCVAKASLVNNDNFTLNDGTNSATTFEYKINGGFTPVGGRVTIDVSSGAVVTPNDVAVATVTAINGVVGGLAITAGTPSTTGQFVLTNDAGGAIGNQLIINAVANSSFQVIGMASGSDAGQFNVNQKMSPVPTAGAIFRIEQPAVTFNVSTAINRMFATGSAFWGMKGISWAGAAGATLAFNYACHCDAAEGIWFNGPGFQVQVGSILTSGSNSGRWANDGANNPFNATRASAGIYIKTTAINVINNASVMDPLWAVIDSAALVSATGSFIRFMIPSMKNASMNPGGFGNARIQGDSSSTLPIVGRMIGSSSSLTNQILIDQGGELFGIDTGPCEFFNSLNDVIHVSTGGFVQTVGGTGNVRVSGFGAAGYGIRLGIASSNYSSWNNASIILTGTLGDTKIGAQPMMTWSAIVAVAPASGTAVTDARASMTLPLKKTFTGLVAAGSFDLTSVALGSGPPALAVSTLRATAATTANTVGSYSTTDVGGTPLSPVASTVVGLATLSDNGKTVTFPTADVTAFIIEYIPADTIPAYSYSQLVKNF